MTTKKRLNTQKTNKKHFLQDICMQDFVKVKENKKVENKNFKPFVPADKVVPEFTVFSVILGAILAAAGLFGAQLPHHVGAVIVPRCPDEDDGDAT